VHAAAADDDDNCVLPGYLSNSSKLSTDEPADFHRLNTSMIHNNKCPALKNKRVKYENLYMGCTTEVKTRTATEEVFSESTSSSDTEVPAWSAVLYGSKSWTMDKGVNRLEASKCGYSEQNTKQMKKYWNLHK